MGVNKKSSKTKRRIGMVGGKNPLDSYSYDYFGGESSETIDHANRQSLCDFLEGETAGSGEKRGC